MLNHLRLTSVTVVLAALIVGSSASLAQNRNINMQDFALSNGQPIAIESQQMDVDEGTGKATFTGGVKVVQGATTLTAGKMIVHLGQGASLTSGASEFDKIELSGSVNMRSGAQAASADQGSINMTSQTIVLSGKEVVLTEGQSVFMGCKLTVNMASGDARLESCGDRIKLLLNPKSRE